MLLVFVILLKPAWIGTLPGLNRIWMLAQCGVLVPILMMTSVNRISRVSGCVVLLSALMLCSAVVNGAEIMPLLRYLVPYAGMALACDRWMAAGRGDEMLRMLDRVLSSFAWINFATILLWPDGLYQAVTADGETVVKCWFLGYKNPQIRILLPALVVLATVNRNARERIVSTRFWLTAAMVIATTVLVDSAMGMVVAVGFVVLTAMLSGKKNRLVGWVTPGVVMMILVGGTLFALSRWGKGTESEYLQVVFPNRNVETMSQRTFVWEAAVKLIGENWLMGRGSTAFEAVGGWSVSHPHNYILFLWMYGGICSVLTALGLFYGVLKNLYRKRDGSLSRVYMAAIAMCFVMGVAESLTEFPMLYALAAVAERLSTKEEMICDAETGDGASEEFADSEHRRACAEAAGISDGAGADREPYQGCDGTVRSDCIDDPAGNSRRHAADSAGRVPLSDDGGDGN